MAFPPSQIADQLLADGIVAAVEWHPSVTSTNLLALAAAADGAPDGTVIGADEQTAGRGRRGRTWHAPAGSSVMLSIVLRPRLPPTAWSVLPLAAGLAIHDVASRFCPDADVALKWPNDLLVDGEKAAGVLLEAAGGAVVVGIGLNTDWRDVQRPDGLVATSLAEHAAAVDRADVLDALLRRLPHWMSVADADPAGIVTAYIPRCGTIGRRVVAVGVAGGTGTAVSLTADGHLRIRPDGGGPDLTVTAGEVQHLR